MGSVTRFPIKISGYQGVPCMMAFTPKASKPSFPAVGTRERYVTLPHLASNFSDFAIRNYRPLQSPISDIAITAVWHSTNDGENDFGKRIRHHRTTRIANRMAYADDGELVADHQSGLSAIAITASSPSLSYGDQAMMTNPV
jgi:hypothetical protein